MTLTEVKQFVHENKGLDTWKSNNLQKEIDKKILELYPEETGEKKQLRELNSKIENMEKKSYERY